MPKFCKKVCLKLFAMGGLKDKNVGQRSNWKKVCPKLILNCTSNKLHTGRDEISNSTDFSLVLFFVIHSKLYCNIKLLAE